MSKIADNLSHNDIFWSEIRNYIDQKKMEIEEQRGSKRGPARVCPACSSSMSAEDLHGVVIDRCVKCDGIFLDPGELDLLFKTNQEVGFIPALKKFLEK